MKYKSSAEFVKVKLRVKRAAENHEGIEKILLSAFEGDKKPPGDLLDNYDENVLVKLYFIIRTIKTSSLADKWKYYIQLISVVSNESTFYEKYDFYPFFSHLIRNLKIDSKRLKSHDFGLLKPIIAELKKFVNPLKKAGFQRVIACVLTALYFISFKILQYKQSGSFELIIDNKDAFLRDCEKYDKMALGYYFGRLALYRNDLNESEKYLELSLKYCDNKRLVRKIMKILIIVKMQLNIFPSKTLFQVYDLNEFKKLSDAIKNGCVFQFEEALEKQRDKWMSDGTYFVISELRTLLLRNLVKNVFKVSKNRKLSFDLITDCYNIKSKKPISRLSIINMISSLVIRSFVNGEIRIQDNILKLSREDQFPLE